MLFIAILYPFESRSCVVADAITAPQLPGSSIGRSHQRGRPMLLSLPINLLALVAEFIPWILCEDPEVHAHELPEYRGRQRAQSSSDLCVGLVERRRRWWRRLRVEVADKVPLGGNVCSGRKRQVETPLGIEYVVCLFHEAKTSSLASTTVRRLVSRSRSRTI